ncbi:IMP-specific 5'-nucleotidase-domain-containing protein [Blastocladiella britannica]|nr:IMP-specific 5'-nucleotidase-domain-containing protein [Blastocladiella britannica]
MASSHYSAYRVNYALRSHKRDAFIEFIKAQLLSPFALHARPLLLEGGENENSDLTGLRDHYASIFASVEHLVLDHMAEQHKKKPQSRLQMLVPTLGKFLTPLPLRDAFLEYDERSAMSQRRHVAPSFNEIRNILNSAQIIALAPDLELITFDGDMTLYDDGANFEEDSTLVQLLVRLISFTNLHVAIVTAAGYEEAERYEYRLSGLLRGFATHKLPASAATKFWVMGGEANYLFRTNEQYRLQRVHLPFLPEDYFAHMLAKPASEGKRDDLALAAALANPGASSAAADASDKVGSSATSAVNGGGQVLGLETVAVGAAAASTEFYGGTDADVGLAPPLERASSSMLDLLPPAHNPAATAAAVTALLDVAERVLRATARSMRLPARVIRKSRAVGIIAASPDVKLQREQLDECVLGLQHALAAHTRERSGALPPVPWCAFNGGADCWVDVGNKLIGVKLLCEVLRIESKKVVHVGDQFLSTGNDFAARRGCPTLWIASPQETANAVGELIRLMETAGRSLCV